MHSIGATRGKGWGEVMEFGYGVVRARGWMQLGAGFRERRMVNFIFGNGNLWDGCLMGIMDAVMKGNTR